MRVFRSRLSVAVFFMIAAGSAGPARADQPAAPAPPPPAAPPAPAPALTSVSPPQASPPAPPASAPAAPSGSPAAPPPAPPGPAPAAGPPPPPGLPPPGYWGPRPGYPPYDYSQIERPHRRKTLPSLVTYKPGMPVFDGYHLEERRPRWPLAVGLPTFGVGYVTAFLIGAFAGGIASDEEAWAPMFVPVVGPFIAVETAKKTIEFDGERVVMAASGAFQIVGLAITALHWALPASKLLVLDGKIQLRPTTFAGTTGLAATF